MLQNKIWFTENVKLFHGVVPIWLKVPKRELFVTELFTLSDPINQPPTAFNFALA
jgi:hypothetical protein